MALVRWVGDARICQGTSCSAGETYDFPLEKAKSLVTQGLAVLVTNEAPAIEEKPAPPVVASKPSKATAEKE